MPLDEEGAKWSCEPCIRGHRSSKCQHFDRLMMKVPKAGRPLAKCPHPKGTCSCQKTYAFMVRIPKGSTCLCRPLYKVPAETDGSSQPTPSVPSGAASVSSRVQKPGRRQSHIQAAPESIARALEAMPDNLKLEDGVSQQLPTLQSHQSEQNGSYPTAHLDNGAETSSTSRESVQDTQTAAAESSCCSKKPEPSPSIPSNGGSCCEGKIAASQTSDRPSNTSNGLKTDSTAWRDLSYVNFMTPQTPTWQSPMANQAQFLQPFGMRGTQPQTLYMGNYAPNVSSPPYANMTNGLGISESGITSSANSLNPTFTQTTATTTTTGSDPCHDCNCGEDCQCLGCATHPFNNTTRQRVQEMGVLMASDGDGHTPEAIANAYQSPPFQGGAATTPLDFYMQNSTSMDNAVPQTPFNPYSNSSSAMPSGYSTPLQPTNHSMNQQLMHPSEYYTLEYPVGLPGACSDVTGSCQCGNDCSCVGCLTHSGHNGVSLEAPIPESSVANTADQQGSSHGPPTTTSGITSRLSALENVSVPCLSPRNFETSMI